MSGTTSEQPFSDILKSIRYGVLYKRIKYADIRKRKLPINFFNTKIFIYYRNYFQIIFHNKNISILNII